MVVTDDQRRRVALSQNGDHEAFESLIREHQRMIYSLCFRMTGSVAEAEDLAQETFIHAYHHLKSFRDEARFSSWLYRIALNQCLNWLKHSERQKRLQEEWSQQAQVQSDNVSDRAQQIQEALLKLNPKQRTAIILTSYDGLTHGEAAQALGCSETTISWRLFAARRKLRRFLRELKVGRKGTEYTHE